MIPRVLAAVLATAVAFLGVHVVLLAATVVIVATVAILLYLIASVITDCGGRTVPQRRRSAW